jgi:hypothetical protein
MKLYYYDVTYFVEYVNRNITKYGFTIANDEDEAIEKIRKEYDSKEVYVEERNCIELDEIS